MNVKNFSLGIGDLLGIMIPGIIWVLFLFHLHLLYPQILQSELSDFSKGLSTQFPNDSLFLNSFLLFFFSYVLGYLSRLAPPIFIDKLTAPIASFSTEKKFKEVIKINFKDRIQPYDFLFSKQVALLQEIRKDITEFTGPSTKYSLFHFCKRIILQYSPKLWSEIQRREAEVRFINSLIYIVFALTALFIIHLQFIYCLSSLLLLLFLLIAFRRRRYAEVSFTYTSGFIVLKELEENKRPHN
jgi:ABC-type multidrug transport system fused ATPase/permease subunit